MLIARAFAGAALGGILGLAFAGPIGLVCGAMLGAAFSI